MRVGHDTHDLRIDGLFGGLGPHAADNMFVSLKCALMDRLACCY